jgi:hypothetical protein
MLSTFIASHPFASSRNIAPILFALLCACGGGGGGDSGGGAGAPSLQTGQFIDGRVQGIAYSSASGSGVTDASGTFQFGSGQSVTFCLGTITNGVCQGFNLGTAPGKFLMQVRDLSGGLALVEQNKLRLLQALDSDNDLSNGIDISAGMRTVVQPHTLNFNQTTTLFASSFSAIAPNLQNPLGRLPTLPSATAAQDHANRTLACEMTGLLEGSYSGSDSGVFEAIIQPNGLIVIRGQSSVDTTSKFTGIGTVPTTAGAETFVVGSTTTGATFSGTLNSTGISGNWSNTGASGTFTGSRKTLALAPGTTGDIYRGVFSGDDLGGFILAINSSNAITGQFYSASDNTFGSLSGTRTVSTSLSTTTVSVNGTFPAGSYTGAVRNDGKSVFLDGAWQSVHSGVAYTGFAMGCLVGTPGAAPTLPSVASTTGSKFVTSGSSGVTGGSGGTISQAKLDRVVTQITTGSCCIPGTF